MPKFVTKRTPASHTFVSLTLNPLANDKFHTSKLKEFADDNFKLEENGRWFFNKVENAVGKGEIDKFKTLPN